MDRLLARLGQVRVGSLGQESGLGSPVGAIAGGFLIAFSEVTITYAWKKVLVYALPKPLEPTGLVQLLSTDYKYAVSFSLLVLVLLFRPTGLFRGKSV